MQEVLVSYFSKRPKKVNTRSIYKNKGVMALLFYLVGAATTLAETPPEDSFGSVAGFPASAEAVSDFFARA